MVGSADPQSTRAFQRVLAKEPSETDRKMDQLIKKIEKHDKTIQEPSGFRKLLEKGMGRKTEKSPLDLEPDELERLLKVKRDPSNQLKFDIKVDTDKLLTPRDPIDIEKKVALFYQNNRLRFDSPNDLKFEPASLKLHYEGPEDISKDLLQTAIGFKEDEAKKIVEKAKREHEAYSADIQFETNIDPKNLLKPKSPEEIVKIVDQFYEDNRYYFEDAKDIQFNKELGNLTYSGPGNVAEDLLKKIGFKEADIKSLTRYEERKRPKVEKPVHKPTLPGWEKYPEQPQSTTLPGGPEDIEIPEEKPKEAKPEKPKEENIKAAIPMSKFVGFSPELDFLQAQLEDWLKKRMPETLRYSTAKFAVDEATKEMSLLFTGPPSKLADLLGRFQLSPEDIDTTLKNKEYLRR